MSQRPNFMSKMTLMRLRFLILLFAIALTATVFYSNILWLQVSSLSMAPTLGLGYHTVSFYIHSDTDISYGDILCFSPYTSANGYLGVSPEQRTELYVKRVIGLPGDTIEIQNGTLYLNGVQQIESYVSSDGPTQNYPKSTVPEGCYFLLGDNRSISIDSREIGAIPRENLVSKVILYFPSLTGTYLEHRNEHILDSF